MSRIIVNYLPKFHTFRDVAIRHIPHHYSEEMKTKSQTVSENFLKFMYKETVTLLASIVKME